MKLYRSDLVVALERALDSGEDPHTFVIQEQGVLVTELRRLQVSHEIEAMISWLKSINSSFTPGDMLKAEEDYEKELKQKIEELHQTKERLAKEVSELEAGTIPQAPAEPESDWDFLKRSCQTLIDQGKAGIAAAETTMPEYFFRNIADGSWTKDMFTEMERDQLLAYLRKREGVSAPAPVPVTDDVPDWI